MIGKSSHGFLLLKSASPAWWFRPRTAPLGSRPRLVYSHPAASTKSFLSESKVMSKRLWRISPCTAWSRDDVSTPARLRALLRNQGKPLLGNRDCVATNSPVRERDRATSH